MHLIAAGGMIQHYDSPESIMRDHAQTRLDLYRSRLEIAGASLDAEADRCTQEAAFVDAVSTGKVQLTGVPTDTVVQRIYEVGIGTPGGNSDSLSARPDYAELRRKVDSLLRMPLSSLTSENSTKIRERAALATTTATIVRKIKPELLWEAELMDARAGLQVWCGQGRPE